MAFLFTLLYIITAYVTPPVLFGPLAEYHVEVVLALLAALSSIPSVGKSAILRTPQSWAIAGLAFAVAISIAQTGWLGGALLALYAFMQPVITFYVVAINCKTKRHLQWMVLAFFLGSVFFTISGALDLHNDVAPSLYLYEDGTLRRLRGLGFVADPNDLSQVLVSLVPAVFLWRQKSAVGNLFLIGLPIVFLFVAMYMTHSRGVILAIVGVIALAVRRKIGSIVSALIAGTLFLLSSVINWSGGRNVSMEAGADRLDLWYGGMQLIKTHPLFGVGLDRFPDYFGITAHNSVVIAAAETGLIGLFFWVLFIFSTMRTALALSKSGLSKKQEEPDLRFPSAYPVEVASADNNPPYSEAQPSIPAQHEQDPAAQPFPWLDNPMEPTSHEQIRSAAVIIIYSITGMLITGWFLSRALSQWLFMYCGMIHTISRWSVESGFPVRRDKPSFLLPWSLGIQVLLLLCLYLTLRLRNLG